MAIVQTTPWLGTDSWAAERARLVKLCARLSGSPDAAEDLAQETLIEAWRNEHKLRDVERRTQWLAGIARNVCLRWRRREYAEEARQAWDEDGSPASDTLDELAGPVDLEQELERHELVELLDRALALLPPMTRAVLVERFVEESSQAEVAARLGLSQGTVAVRVHRGKILLRQTLANTFFEEAVVYGLATAPTPAWHTTRIWCPMCGQDRLRGILHYDRPGLALECRACRSAPHVYYVDIKRGAYLNGVRGYKPALFKMLEWFNTYFARFSGARRVACDKCDGRTSLHPGLPPQMPPFMDGMNGLYTRCDRCGSTTATFLNEHALALPQARRFWQEHPRMRTLPERWVEIDGRGACISRFESLQATAALDVVWTPETLRVIDIRRG